MTSSRLEQRPGKQHGGQEPDAVRRTLERRSAMRGPGPGVVDALRRRRRAEAALLLSLLVAVVLTLSPRGSGWAWGSPLPELQRYLVFDTAARFQLFGNLLLLGPAAASATVLWPRLGRAGYRWRAALAAGAAIELLQLVLPLGRVVSPLDAVLNAAGAVCAAAATARALRLSPPPCQEDPSPAAPSAGRPGPPGGRAQAADPRLRRHVLASYVGRRAGLALVTSVAMVAAWLGAGSIVSRPSPLVSATAVPSSSASSLTKAGVGLTNEQTDPLY